MEIKKSLFHKLLYHFQIDPEWAEFFRALLQETDWSIYDHVSYTDEDNVDYLSFNLNYSLQNRFPLLFNPGSYYNFRYALSLYKVPCIGIWENAYALKLDGYTQHWLNNPIFLDTQNVYSPHLHYCFPHSTIFDSLYQGHTHQGPLLPPTIEIDLVTDKLAEIYGYSHNLIVLTEPITDFTLAELQDMQNRLVYLRQYEFRINAQNNGIGYTPNRLPDALQVYTQEDNFVIAKFIKDSVSARIEIPINFEL